MSAPSARKIADALDVSRRQVCRWRARGLDPADPVCLVRDLGEQRRCGSTFYSLAADPDRVLEILEQLDRPQPISIS